MSIKTNKPSNVIAREYGRRMYMSKKPYAEQIRIPAQKAADNEIETKHSELKKPYLSDTYEEMEHFADAPIGYAFSPTSSGYGLSSPGGPMSGSGGSGFDTPWMGIPTPDFPEMYTPWHLLFMCGWADCYCEGSETCFNLSCTHEIVGVDIKFPPLYRGWKVRGSGSKVCVTPPDGATGSIYVDVNMRAPRPWPSPHGTSKFVYGTHGGISISACPEKECCNGTVTSWDTVKSVKKLARGANSAVFVVGSGTEVDWTISGTGFWFDAGSTVTSLSDAGLSVTVYAQAAVACGVATITATGCDGSTSIGYVVCTTGVWSDCNPLRVAVPYGSGSVGGAGSGAWSSPDFRFQAIVGFWHTAAEGATEAEMATDCDGTPVSPAVIRPGVWGERYRVASSEWVYYDYWKCA